MTIAPQALLFEFLSSIEPPSAEWYAIARAHLDSLTKPVGSLGRLEDLAAQMVSIRRERSAELLHKAVYVFAADHGVAVEGVSAYPSEVTRQMVLNFVHDGAAINVLARLHGAEMNVVDVGVDAEFGELSGMLHRKVRRGTCNMLREPAMSEDEMKQALAVGLELAATAKEKGQNLIAAGEMGIGNTTAASAITAVLTRKPVALVTGTGTGLSLEAHARKQKIVAEILDLHFPALEGDAAPEALEVLRCVGGLEIAAMTGLMLGAAQHGIAVIADGFISIAAAAIACAIAPRARGYFFSGHQSEEPGHQALLEHLGWKPILNLGMRLGEGSGAVLAMPLIESAMAIYNQMATFASAGVSGANE